MGPAGDINTRSQFSTACVYASLVHNLIDQGADTSADLDAADIAILQGEGGLEECPNASGCAYAHVSSESTEAAPSHL